MYYTLQELKYNFDKLTSIWISELDSEHLVSVRCYIGPELVSEKKYNYSNTFKGRMIWFFFKRFFEMPKRRMHFSPRKDDNMTNFIYTVLFLR